jgi:hypothetical protein
MKWLGVVSMLWVAAGVASAAQVYNYWIQPCTDDLAGRSGCGAADLELGRWALEAWQQAAGSGLRFAPASEEDDALVRIYWLGRTPQLYGDTHVVFLKGKRVRVIEVQPDLSQFGAQIEAAGRHDKLFRDTVVYLTCLHELGHAVGLDHTADFADIMYSFQYGGDVLEYFGRYRRKLRERADIRGHSGISEADRRRVASLYASP